MLFKVPLVWKLKHDVVDTWTAEEGHVLVEGGQGAFDVVTGKDLGGVLVLKSEVHLSIVVEV